MYTSVRFTVSVAI